VSESEEQAKALLEEWMSAFNARDLDRWAATFNCPSRITTRPLARRTDG